MLARFENQSRFGSRSRFLRGVAILGALALTGGLVAAASDRSPDKGSQPELIQASLTTQTLTPRTLKADLSADQIEAELMAEWDGIYRVHGVDTPSGFDVPRFVSLKFGRVNARTGPSRNHSIAYQYQRRGLPLIVVAETEMWRKVRDVDGDEAWVRKPALSGERHAIFQLQSDIKTKPSPDADAVARVEKGALVKLEACETSDYCEVRTASGFKGYAPKAVLWGAQDMN